MHGAALTICGPAALTVYLPSFALRRGRRANHQTLTMVATTPNAAAGLAILCERSGIHRRYPEYTRTVGPLLQARQQTDRQILIWFFRSSSRSPIPSLGSP